MCQDFLSPMNFQFTSPQQDLPERNPVSIFESFSQNVALDCKSFPYVSHMKSLMFGLS